MSDMSSLRAPWQGIGIKYLFKKNVMLETKKKYIDILLNIKDEIG